MLLSYSTNLRATGNQGLKLQRIQFPVNMNYIILQDKPSNRKFKRRKSVTL